MTKALPVAVAAKVAVEIQFVKTGAATITHGSLNAVTVIVKVHLEILAHASFVVALKITG